MTTRRERLEAKLDKRQEWAEKAATRSDAAFNATHRLMDGIPLGQPILVGHHSEKRARKDAERIDNGMSKAVAESKLADHHKEKAAGLAQQLDKSIFSDDTDALEALEARIAEREAKAASMVAMNKAWRKSKSDPAVFAKLVEISIEAAEKIAARIAKAYSWEQQPYPSWELSNLRATIRADKQRIEEIKARQARTERAEECGGVTIEGSGDYVSITFVEKPERDVLTALKDAGFRWSRGSWYGRRDAIPAVVNNG
jgi:hypothetical protein